jgi:phage terminase small subunit
MLRPRQQIFVEEYLKDLDAQQAALRAGYKGNTGSELLKNPNIAEAIKEAIEERQARTQVTVDLVVAELAKIAFSDLTDFVTWKKSGRIGLRPCDQIDGHVLSSIEETISSGGAKTRKVKLYDKLKALELLGKHLGMFTDNLNLSGNVSVQIVDDIK